ncbi:hypothetical protein ACOSQ4_032858 [Xanthoceras sorbifolium]
MGPVEGAATGMFHSVKNLDEVDGEAVRVGDIDKRVSISDGLLNGPGQMEFMADNLMEVKLGFYAQLRKFLTARARNRFNGRPPKLKLQENSSDSSAIYDLEEGKKASKKLSAVAKARH